MKKFRISKDLDDFTMTYISVDQQKRVNIEVAILLDQRWKSRVDSLSLIHIFLSTEFISNRLDINKSLLLYRHISYQYSKKF